MFPTLYNLYHAFQSRQQHVLCDSNFSDSKTMSGRISSLFSQKMAYEFKEATPEQSQEKPQETPPDTASAFKPIQFEHYSKEYTQMATQDTFDGFRLEVGKPMTKYLQASHSLLLGTSLRETGQLYQFGPTFGFDNGSTFIMTRYGNDGILNARAMKKLSDNYEGRLSFSSSLDQEQQNMAEGSLDKMSKDWCASAKLAWQAGMWVTNLGFSQLIAPNLHFGSDITWVSSTGGTAMSIGARYSCKSHIFSALLSRQPDLNPLMPMGFSKFAGNTHSCKLRYFRKISDRLSLGTECELNESSSNFETGLRCGYEYLFRVARVQGLIDADGKISMNAQNTSGFGVNAVIDFWKGDYKFGFMMQIFPGNEHSQPTEKQL